MASVASPEEAALERIREARSSGATTLDLAHLGLRALPTEIHEVPNLQILLLNDNELVSLPDELSQLERLYRLDVQDNRLTSLPALPPQLEVLDADNNRLTELPDSLWTASELSLLYLTDNQLTQLPAGLGRLTALRTLTIARNQLRTLPVELADLALTRVDFSSNPLDEPLPALLDNLTDLYSYLRSLEDARAQYEGKLLLVGEGEVGKSSLVAALNDGAFLQKRDSTHGIEVTTLRFQHPDLSVDMLLNAWDFGGQEIYRITHQFFFSRRALYLVVWKPRQGQDENAIEEWCRRISLRVGDEAKILLVSTHANQRAAELDYPLLQNRFGGVLVGKYAVDSEDQTGVDALRAAIAEHAAALPQMGERVSAAWQAARAELLALPQAHISYTHFAHICARHALDADATRALARMLHNLGLVIRYEDDDGLRDVVVLQPEWLTKAISYVLEDAPTRQANGVLDHHRLADIWSSADMGGYSDEDFPFFLRLMEKFDVSYRIPDTEKSLIGQLVPYERPDIPWSESDRVRTLSLRCPFSEPVEGLISWLTVRHHRFSVGVHWRRGVFLEHREWGSQALLEMIDDSELSVTVRGPSPDALFSVLRDGIEYLIAQRWDGLSYELLVPCTGELENGSRCPDSFKFRHLMRDREAGELQTRCSECRTRYDIAELLTGFTPPRTSLQVELAAMQAKLVAKLDDIGTDVIEIKELTSESANQVRSVLRAVSAEVTDCPRLFTLVPTSKKGISAMRIWQTKSRMTLWCEHTDHEHPWPAASYEIQGTKEWAAQLAPYAALVVKTLQIIVPIGVAGVGVQMSEEHFKAIKAELDLMKVVVEQLPTPAAARVDQVADGGAGHLTKAEGGGLRALRALLEQTDKNGIFGGLRRRLTPAGDFVWICPDHIHEYDPGLPVLPS